MTETKDQKRIIIQEQLTIYELNFNKLRDCDQLLITYRKLNINCDFVSSFDSMINTGVKRYCSALFAFRMNLLNSIPVLHKRHFPTSLTPLEALLAIMDSVSLRLSKAEDRLNVAILASDLLT